MTNLNEMIQSGEPVPFIARDKALAAAFKSGVLRIGMIVSKRTMQGFVDQFMLLGPGYGPVWFVPVRNVPIDSVDWHPADMEELGEWQRRAGAPVTRVMAWMLVNEKEYVRRFGVYPDGSKTK